MNQRVIELNHKKIVLEIHFKRESDRLNDQRKLIISKCTHPEIGEYSMWVCPDCRYNGLPEYPEELSDRDYYNYEVNIEKERIRNRSRKAKFSRQEIKEMILENNDKLEILEKNLKLEIKPIKEEWGEIQSKCDHVLGWHKCINCAWDPNGLENFTLPPKLR